MNNVLFLPVKIIGETLNDKEENEESLIFKVSEVSSLIMDSIFDYFISQNNQDRIYLKIPEFDELDYYKEILADEKTMSYNSGYDLNLDGYDYESGCIKSFDVDKWYKKITTDKNRYFAYIIDSISNSPVGYVTFHLDEKTLKHRLGIVVNYSYRNRGYATKALKKICDIAFLKYGVNSLVVNIPYHMNYALKLAKKGGFIDTNNDYFVNKFGKRERCIVLELNKIDYID